MNDLLGKKFDRLRVIRHVGIHVHTIWARLDRGWSVRKALTTPLLYNSKG